MNILRLIESESPLLEQGDERPRYGLVRRGINAVGRGIKRVGSFAWRHRDKLAAAAALAGLALRSGRDRVGMRVKLGSKNPDKVVPTSGGRAALRKGSSNPSTLDPENIPGKRSWFDWPIKWWTNK